MIQVGAKNRRDHELLSDSQRRTMRWLIENGYGIEAVAERYGLNEEAAEKYVKQACKTEPVWQVRWDDSRGDSHVKRCCSFRAAKDFHATLKDVEWSRVERV